jgi:hypothetical protein
MFSRRGNMLRGGMFPISVLCQFGHSRMEPRLESGAGLVNDRLKLRFEGIGDASCVGKQAVTK